MARSVDVSRTFLYDNPEARSTVAAAMTQAGQTRTSMLAGQAAKFADRLIKLDGDDRQRIDQAVRLTLSRPAADDEMNDAEAFLRQYRDKLRASGSADDRLDCDAWAAFVRVLWSGNELIYLD